MSDESYRVTTLRLRKIAELPGVPTLDFWQFEEELTEADFEAREELNDELEKVSQNLITVLVEQEEKEEERREMCWEEEKEEKKDQKKTATEEESDDDEEIIKV